MKNEKRITKSPIPNSEIGTTSPGLQFVLSTDAARGRVDVPFSPKKENVERGRRRRGADTDSDICITTGVSTIDAVRSTRSSDRTTMSASRAPSHVAQCQPPPTAAAFHGVAD